MFIFIKTLALYIIFNCRYLNCLFSGLNKSNCNSHLNTTITSVKIMTPKSTFRKFPGPAGLLSENVNT